MHTLILALLFAQSSPALTKDKLIGTWKLLSYWNISATGEKSAPYGEHPTGFITYTTDGHMSAIFTADGRKPLSTVDRFAAGEAERANAFTTLVAYAGTYRIDGDKVIHHVEVAWLQSWVGTEVVRTVKLDGDRVVLRTESRAVRGVQQVGELTWQRVP